MINRAWLGGLVDGDGYIYISKLGYVTIEITVGIEDLKMLSLSYVYKICIWWIC